MPSARFYNALYRIGAPWGGAPRPELVRLVDSRRVTPLSHPRALDLGCGAGEDSLFLAERGFEVVGIDFSRRAIELARAKARRRGLEARTRFVEADLTASGRLAVEGRFDLLFDGGSLDDLQGRDREAAARNVGAWARPGAVFLLWCFFGALEELPWISFVGASRVAPGFVPGEVERLFGKEFEVEPFEGRPAGGRFASFLLTRRE